MGVSECVVLEGGDVAATGLGDFGFCFSAGAGFLGFSWFDVSLCCYVYRIIVSVYHFEWMRFSL